MVPASTSHATTEHAESPSVTTTMCASVITPDATSEQASPAATKGSPSVSPSV